VETVNVVEPLTEPKVAVIVLLPLATLVARPCALMVATADEDDVQSTEGVTSCTLESLKVPIAANCFVVPTAIVGFAGVTLTETSVAEDTVSVAVPLIDPEVAVIVAVPAPTPDARPFMSMLATELGAALQVREVSN
jgi:hypothetical protein